MYKLIDGKAISNQIKLEIAEEVEKWSVQGQNVLIWL